jgi:hypothetical protein
VKNKANSIMRKIVETIRITDNYPFGKNKVLLECGHTTLSNALYKARCTKCKEEAPIITRDMTHQDYVNRCNQADNMGILWV